MNENTYTDDNFSFIIKNNNSEVWIVLKSTFEIEESSMTDINNHFIIAGYKSQLLEEQVKTLFENYKVGVDNEICISKSKKAINGIDASYELLVEDPRNKIKINEEDIRVDLKTHLNLVHVLEGQEIMKVIPETFGEQGYDVFGDLIEPIVGKTLDIKFGKNTTYDNDSNILFSLKSGLLKYEGDTIYIEESLVVDGDLDISIGNVNTEVPIIVTNDIKSGFSVISEKDILVQGNVEGADVQSTNGRVVILGGVLGQNKANIYGLEGIDSKFVLNANLTSKGDIKIEDSIIYSNINCGKTLTLFGETHGVIIGGNIRITNTIKSKSIGSINEPTVHIYMGFDFKFENEIKELDKNILLLRNDIDVVTNSLVEVNLKLSRLKSGEDYGVFLDRKHKYEIHLIDLKKDFNDKMKSLKRVERESLLDVDSEIYVTKNIFRNTHLHMFRKSIKIDNELNNVKITYKPNVDEINIENLA
jgi:uncharacterized protein (DUF342 family)